MYSCLGKLGEHMRSAGVYQVQLALSAGEGERREAVLVGEDRMDAGRRGMELVVRSSVVGSTESRDQV